MTKSKAIEILQKHIDTYRYQLTDAGFAEMVNLGIAKPTLREKIEFKADAIAQIEAYEMAIKALSEEK